MLERIRLKWIPPLEILETVWLEWDSHPRTPRLSKEKRVLTKRQAYQLLTILILGSEWADLGQVFLDLPQVTIARSPKASRLPSILAKHVANGERQRHRFLVSAFAPRR